MVRLIPVSTVFFSLLLTIISCSKDNGGGGNGNDCSTNTSKTFAAHVNPIIQSTCNQATCHNTGSINGPGPLTTYAQISSNATAIRTAIQSGSMPKNSSLTTAQKNSIICWIDAGALNN